MTTISEHYSAEGHHEKKKVLEVSSINDAPQDLRATVNWNDGDIQIDWIKSESLKLYNDDPKAKRRLENEVARAVRAHATGCYEVVQHRLAKCYFSFKKK